MASTQDTKKMFNTTNTKAILIGVSEFEDAKFVNASPIKNNVTYLYDLFQEDKILGLAQKDILLLNKNETHGQILKKIKKLPCLRFILTLFNHRRGEKPSTRSFVMF